MIEGGPGARVASESRAQLLVPEDHFSGASIQNMLAFGQSMFKAKYAIFYWYGPKQEMTSLQEVGLPKGLMEFYYDNIISRDPLAASLLWHDRKKVAMLRDERGAFLTPPDPIYVDYLDSFAVGDELDLVFWSHDTPVAAMAIVRDNDSKSFAADGHNWATVRTHFNSIVKMHWRSRTHWVSAMLRENFRINPRELEVIELVVLGRSNQDIADLLGIKVATAKTHLVNIFDKLGVDSRSAITAKVSSLQFAEN